MLLQNMSDAQLDRAVEAYYDKLYMDAYERTEPHCKDCIHYCKSSKQCEQYDKIFEEESYVSVNPDDPACEDFEADEHLPETDY